MRTTGNFLIAAAQILYLLLTPWWVWWYFGGAGLVGWIAFTGVWMGASVVIWSGYQQWRAKKRSTLSLLARILFSPLLGTAWIILVAALLLRFAFVTLLQKVGPRNVRQAPSH